MVYQSYIESMSMIEREKKTIKESVLQLTFKTLRKLESYKKRNRMQPPNSVTTQNVKKILQQIRPHYNNAKVKIIFQYYFVHFSLFSVLFENITPVFFFFSMKHIFIIFNFR